MNFAPKEAPTFFYHSFPRKPNHQNRALGLKILDSILEKGLLLTAELRKFPPSEGLRKDTFVQQRVCFTALTPDRLARHAETFGSFSLEFEGTVIRNFGALPAVYFSGRLPNGELLNDSGETLARHLLETYRDLKRLWDLKDRGTTRQIKLANTVLKKIHPSRIQIQKLYFALQALLNLYYPTDDQKWTGALHYYHQREWKIIPNFAYKNTWHYKALTKTQRSELLKLNPKFFNAKLNGKPRVDLCSCFYDVGEKNIIESIRRIIVPDDALKEARRLVATHGRKIKVIPASRLKRVLG